MGFNVNEEILDDRSKTIHILSADSSGPSTQAFDTSTLEDAISGQNNIVSLFVEYSLATGDGTPTAPTSLTIQFHNGTSQETLWVAFGNGSVKLSNPFVGDGSNGSVSFTFSGLGSAIITLIKGEGFETTNKHYKKVSGRGN